MHRSIALLAAAAFAALLAASPACAQNQALNGPFGPAAVVAPAGLGPLYASILGGLTTLADYTNAGMPVPEMVTASAAEPVVNATGAQVATAIGTVLAAAMAQSETTGSLGNPSQFTYPMDRKRFALYRFPKGKARGLCIFISGCKHDPHSWFYRSNKCKKCTGLPEEVSHSKQCLAHGFAVIALMAKDQRYRFRCFSSSGDPALSDQADNGVVIDVFSRKFGLTKKPKYIFGISAGAAFAIKFPMTYPVNGVISEVNMPDEDKWGATDGHGHLRVRFPPTAFYMMQRDKKTQKQIKKAVAILNNNGVPSDYVFIKPQPVGPNFLSDRSIFINPDQSAKIQAALHKIGVLDSNDFIKYDVRISRGWIKQLQNALPWLKRKGYNFNLISDESQIWQELNLAWAWHEIISDYVRPTLIWLDGGGRANLNALVNQYSLNGRIACLTEKREGC